ncbi:hypothetical protein [Sinanaerobacter chloroacetimidivorans]|jgi:hypothetical protein|uniref:Smr domain-containing protein n=1 Tax=Sinanaerobacter chloroacetimidivorans TaxID=2818044 RepID=A0A8J7W438_9FIRM|nr:hypothetical protein [Sinanaerobacter chloroacetimidivorans]MBR0599991.1 hypothetical protein [Sinanaerobacter chloroacetimidivorans]
MKKIREINLEYGSPSVDAALRTLVSQLGTCKGQGCKAVVLVHGYGSSGVGGSIKAAVRSKLRESSLQGIVRAYCGGEQWFERKRDFINVCPSLTEVQRKIDGNQGVTIVLIK